MVTCPGRALGHLEKSEPGFLSPQFQTELRKILVSLIEVAQKLLALNPDAVELFKKANGMSTPQVDRILRSDPLCARLRGCVSPARSPSTLLMAPASLLGKLRTHRVRAFCYLGLLSSLSAEGSCQSAEI